MFGAKSVVKNQVIASMRHCMPDLKAEIIYGIENEPELTNDAFDDIVRRFFSNTFDDAAKGLCSGNPMMNPYFVAFLQNLIHEAESTCGYDIDIENLNSAGTVYAILYAFKTGKIAAPVDCIKLNHTGSMIINAAIMDAEKELSRR